MREPGSASREAFDSLMKIRQLKYRILWESMSNQALIHQEIKKISLALIAACAVLVVIYIIIYRKKHHK